MNRDRRIGVKGFTLIEVIVTITIAAVVGAALYQYLGTSLTQSSLPIGRLQRSFNLQQVMENITADYLGAHGGDLPGLQTAIGNEGTNQNNGYGQYGVVNNHFIKFVGYEAQNGSVTDNLLLVTIKNSSNETLTNIFVQ